MKRKTPHWAVLLLLAGLLCALPGAALAQEQLHKLQDAAPPPAGELIFHVAVHKDFATRRCALFPRLFRHPDGSLSSVSEAIGHLSEVEINRLYVEGKVFHYQNWRGERHTCRDVRVEKRHADEDDPGPRSLQWQGNAQCSGSSIIRSRGESNLLLPLTVDLPENPASLSGPDAEDLLARSREIMEQYVAAVFTNHGRTPAHSIREGITLYGFACGDLDGDGVRDCVATWWDKTRATDKRFAQPDARGGPTVVVAVLGDGRSETYIQEGVKAEGRNLLFAAGILPMADGSRTVLVLSSFSQDPADLVDFSSHPPRRVARFID